MKISALQFSRCNCRIEVSMGGESLRLEGPLHNSGEAETLQMSEP